MFTNFNKEKKSMFNKAEATNHCRVCNLNYEPGYEAFILHTNTRDHKMMLELDSLIASINYAAERMAEINAQVKLRPIVPVFDSVHTCPKCNSVFGVSTEKRPSKYYESTTNLMTRTCLRCGYGWKERCADGTEPIWEKIK